MPTIIECPACATRYKMNKPIPEGGRFVKCARCGHQWRLAPEGSAELEDDAPEEHVNSMVSAAHAPEGEGAHYAAPSAGYGGDATGVSDDWHDHQAEHAAPSIRGGMAGQDWGDGDEDSHAALKNAWQDYESKLQDENGEAANGDDGWAERVQRSAWANDTPATNGPVMPAIGDTAHSGDPEIAIRHALNTVLEQPGEQRTAEGGEPDQFQDFWQGFASEEDERERERAGQLDDAMAAVRRSSVIYDQAALREGYTSEDESASDPAIHDGIAAAFQHNTATPKRPARPEYKHDASLTDYDAVGEVTDGELSADYADSDAAALQAELENYGSGAYDEQRRGGGLALVAAWAVFLSIVSGVTLAFVNFRENIMAALPGTTHLYSTLGFDTADRNVDFGNVGYRWTQSGGRPVLEIKGQVINMTDHEVDVPRVLITMHDGQSTDGIKTVETLRNEPLAARETVPFMWEIDAPKTVNQIALEFENVR